MSSQNTSSFFGHYGNLEIDKISIRNAKLCNYVLHFQKGINNTVALLVLKLGARLFSGDFGLYL